MNAIQIHSHGGTEVLQIRSLPTPRPEAGEVLVRVKAAALNPIDASVRQGHFPGAKKPPLILGREAAGVVEQASDGFRAGERVLVASAGGFGVFRDGVWAELIAVPDQWLRRIPDGVNFDQAAALSNTGVTALAAGFGPS